jgi:hypothetical protein
MIVLEKATANLNVTIQLTDNITLVDPLYLFVFTRGGIDYPVICEDLATTSERVRASRFTITEGASDPTNGSLILGTPGVYELNIYEQASTTNLNPDNSTGLVVTTQARINGAETITYIERAITINYIER